MLLIGDRFAIVNTEEDAEIPPARLVIKLTPSHSYGHGWASDTQAAIAALEGQVQPGDTVLDVGAGVGTLALAALALGASHATATEMDPDALAALARNAEANGVTDKLTIVDGTVPEGSYDVVICNIGSWGHTEPHFDALAKASKRALIVTSEHEARTEVQARATLHKLGHKKAHRAENHGRVLDPTASDWAVQELTR